MVVVSGVRPCGVAGDGDGDDEVAQRLPTGSEGDGRCIFNGSFEGTRRG